VSADFHGITATLAEAHARLSVDLLAAVASGYRQGVPAAIRAGVAAHTFCEPEHQAIWTALVVASERDADQLVAAQLVRRAMQSAGLWWPEGPLSTSAGFWNDESVALLFTSYPRGLGIPRLDRMAAEFVDTSARWRRVIRAAGLLDRAVRNAMDGLHPRHGGLIKSPSRSANSPILPPDSSSTNSLRMPAAEGRAA
jgi:hypothetical protein